MKNRKRVLIILSVLIVILAVILVTVLVFGSIKTGEYEDYQAQIESAACEYGINNNYTEAFCIARCPWKVYYSQLIEKEYIDDLVNPITGTKMSSDTSSYVEITWEDGEMVCTLKEG